MNASSAHAASEVLEEYAEGDLKGIFQDIKETMRVPIVSGVFSALAGQPDFLRVAWRQLHTNAQTVYFERQADELRRFAVTAMSDIGEIRTPTSVAEIAPVLDVFHYVNSKVLLAVAALRASLLGQAPRTALLSSGEKRQIAAGVATGMPSITLVGSGNGDERIERLFAEIRSRSRTGMVDTEYRALARWPEYLEGVWTAIRPRLDSPEYQRAVRQLRWMADEAVLGLPFRMDVTAHTLRHAGLSEQQIDGVRTMLNQFFWAASESVANVAVFVTGLEGRRGALEVRYPAQPV